MIQKVPRARAWADQPDTQAPRSHIFIFVQFSFAYHILIVSLSTAHSLSELERGRLHRLRLRNGRQLERRARARSAQRLRVRKLGVELKRKLSFWRRFRVDERLRRRLEHGDAGPFVDRAEVLV